MMDNSTHILAAIAVLIATSLVGFGCRYLPTKWSLSTSLIFGALVGGIIGVLAMQGRISMSFESGATSSRTDNTIFNTLGGPDRIGAAFSLVYLAVIGGVCASAVASESIRKRVLKLQFGEYGWKGPQNAYDKSECKSRVVKEQQKYLPLYLGGGLFLLIFTILFAAGLSTTWNHQKVEGIVLKISPEESRTSRPILSKKVPVTIQYTVDGVSHQFKEYYSEHAVPKLNTKVDVIHEPNNPSNGKVDHRGAEMMIVLGTALCGAWLVWWTISNWKKRLPQ